MKKRRKVKKRWPRVIFAIFLLACCSMAISPRLSSSPASGADTDKTDAGTSVQTAVTTMFSKTVDLSGGSFDKDSTELKVVLQSGETALLNQFESLKKADFSGSTCYDEIAAWAEANPSVKVTYDITMPDGKALSPTETKLDLSSASAAETMKAAEMFKYFPQLSEVSLSNISAADGSLTGEDLASLREANPNVSFTCSVELNGKTYGEDTTTVDLAAIGKDNFAQTLSLLSALPNLNTLELGNGADGSSPFTLDDIEQIYSYMPTVSCNYTLSLYGKTISLSDDHIDINHISVEDDGAAVKQVLRYMPNCEYVDMDSCGVSNKNMAKIRDEFPGVDVVWRVSFGSNYSVRTNVTKILASKPSKGGGLTNDNTGALKYCTKVRYLDLGHNTDLSDFSFVQYMPDLEIMVASITAITDLSPFAGCSNLQWLELGSTDVSDLSPLSSCTKLRHLNVGASDDVRDISPLYDIPLRRLWLGASDPVPEEQVAHMKELHPNIEINTTAPTGRNDPGGPDWSSENWKYYQQLLNQDWSYYENYHVFPAQRPMGYWKVVYKCFQYNLADRAYAFVENDPLYYEHGDDVEPVNVFIIDTSQLDEDFVDNTQDPSSPTYLQPDSLDTAPGETIWVGKY